MAFDNMEEVSGEMETPPPEESNNRSFIIVAAVIGGIMLLSLVCIGLYVGFQVLPNQRAKSQAAAGTSTANAIVAMHLTETAFAPTDTPTPTQEPTDTPLPPTKVIPSNTPVVVDATATPPSEVDTTATAVALQTLIAASTMTVVPTSPNLPTVPAGELPGTGFAEDVGAPALLGFAAILIVVIVLARRMRAAH